MFLNNLFFSDDFYGFTVDKLKMQNNELRSIKNVYILYK